MEKPKNLHHQSNAGVLSFFQQGLNSGKRVNRVTSTSIAGKRMMNTKGSILVQDEARAKREALEAKERIPKHGGAKERARRLKQVLIF